MKATVKRTLEVWLPGTPRPKGNRNKVIRIGTRFSVAASSKDRAHEAGMVKLAARQAPPAPMTGPVLLDATFVMPVPSSWPKWRREAALLGQAPHTARPDRGNLLKLLEDVLEAAGFIADDSRVIGGQVAKVYGPRPGSYARLRELQEPDREAWAVLDSQALTHPLADVWRRWSER